MLEQKMINIFEAELEKGTGIPYLLIKDEIIKASPEVDSIIVDNILNCKAYDSQCEGLRAEYMYSIVKNYHNKEAVFKKVLHFFEKMDGTDWGEQQTFSFVCILAQEKLVFKKIIFDKIRWYIENGKDGLYTIYDFVEKEGLEAAEFVARELGKLLGKNPNHNLACDDGFFSDFHNKEEVRSFLQKSDDNHIKLYLQNIEEPRAFKPYKRKSAEEIIENFYKKNKWYYRIHSWLKKADEDEMRKIAEYAFQSENEKIKYRLISAFDEVKIPVDYEILKSEYLKVENQDFKIQILQAMLLLGKSEVKELVFDLDFCNSDVQELYIKALCIFYDKNENGILLDKIDCLDVYSCHDILQFLIDNENLKNDLDFYKKILNRLYQKNKCSLCRKDIFDRMAENGILDKTVCEEAMYDCNKDIAEKAKEIFRFMVEDFRR